MGMWQPGYLEFHEPSGLSWTVDLSPVTYSCKFCDQSFLSADGLYDHRFSAHPVRQPCLIICKQEITTRQHTVNQALSPSDIHIGHTDSCSLDGKRLSVDELKTALSATRWGVREIVLRSKDGLAETRCGVSIEVPEKEDLEAVSRRFLNITNQGALDVSSIQAFIFNTRQFKTAGNYVDGLSSYLYGVLAKDSRGRTTLAPQDGRVRYNRALQSLRDFETSIAIAVRGILRFALNDFYDAADLTFVPELQCAVHRFHSLISTSPISYPACTQVKHASQNLRVPLDMTLDKLVEWCGMSDEDVVENEPTMNLVFNTDSWSIEDRFKVRLLLASSLFRQGDLRRAAGHARRIRDDVVFGDWADKVIEISKEV